MRQVERYKFTLDYKKLMFIYGRVVYINDGNYLQRTITLVLNFCLTSKNPRTIIRQKKKKKQTGNQARGDDPSQGTQSPFVFHLAYLRKFSPLTIIFLFHLLFLYSLKEELRDVNRQLEMEQL